MLRIVIVLGFLGLIHQSCRGDSTEDWRKQGFYRPRRNYPTQNQNDNSFQSRQNYQSRNTFSTSAAESRFGQNSQSPFGINNYQNTQKQSSFGFNNQPQYNFEENQSFKVNSSSGQNQRSIGASYGSLQKYESNSADPQSRNGFRQNTVGSRVSQNSLGPNQNLQASNNGQNLFRSSFSQSAYGSYNLPKQNSFESFSQNSPAFGNFGQKVQQNPFGNFQNENAFSNFGNVGFAKSQNYHAPDYLPPKPFRAPEYLPPDPKTTSTTTRRPFYTTTTTKRPFYTTSTTKRPFFTTTTTKRPFFTTTTRRPFQTTTSTKRPFYSIAHRFYTTTTTKQPFFTTITTKRPFFTTSTTRRPIYTISTKRPIVTPRPLPAMAMPVPVPDDDDNEEIFPDTITKKPSTAVAPAMAMNVPPEPDDDDDEIVPDFRTTTTKKPTSTPPATAMVVPFFTTSTTRRPIYTISTKRPIVTPRPLPAMAMPVPVPDDDDNEEIFPDTITKKPSTAVAPAMAMNVPPEPDDDGDEIVPDFRTTTTKKPTSTSPPAMAMVVPPEEDDPSSTTSTSTSTPSTIISTTPSTTISSTESTTTSTSTTTVTTPTTTRSTTLSTPSRAPIISTTPDLNRLQTEEESSPTEATSTTTVLVTKASTTTTSTTVKPSYIGPAYLPPDTKVTSTTTPKTTKIPIYLPPFPASRAEPVPEEVSCDPLDPRTWPTEYEQRNFGELPCAPAITTTTTRPVPPPAPARAIPVLPEPECNPLDPSTWPSEIDQREFGETPCGPALRTSATTLSTIPPTTLPTTIPTTPSTIATTTTKPPTIPSTIATTTTKPPTTPSTIVTTSTKPSTIPSTIATTTTIKPYIGLEYLPPDNTTFNVPPSPARADLVPPEPECDPLDPSTWPSEVEQRDFSKKSCAPNVTIPPYVDRSNLPPNDECIPKTRRRRATDVTLRLGDVKGTPRPVWYAGIYRKTTDPYFPICGGSIVREDIVISAAHCFWNDVVGLQSAQLFAVAASKIYKPWKDPMDKKAQKSDVLDIKIPARFLGSKTSFQEDIAILKLATPFKYTRGVKPICVDFDDDFDRQQMKAGHMGTIAGWGLTDSKGTPTQRLLWLELPYIEIEKCIKDSEDAFLKYITCDKVCAGENDTGKALCKGDSGGGLAFWSGPAEHATPYLRGVASTAPSPRNAECNVFAYGSFTHVRAHRTFLRDHVPDIDKCRFWD